VHCKEIVKKSTIQGIIFGCGVSKKIPMVGQKTKGVINET
jgi:hypothetical protein